MAFSKIKGLGAKTLSKYKNAINTLRTDDDAYVWLKQICELYKRVQLVSKDLFLSSCENAHNVIVKQKEQGITAISMMDEYYPKGFLALDDPPLYFFAKGNKEALIKDGIAVIGTRQVTNHSRSVGERFGQVLAEKGWTVVSGLAIGCDTSGHVGCLRGEGITIAIVATPLDQVYPKQNTQLQEQILENNGCVISEYPLGEKFSPYNLVARDRLQAALAQGVIVVATGFTGGTYHAINTAEKIRKPVGCFNYKDTYYEKDPHALGNREMIKSGRAIPLYDQNSIDDFLYKCKPQAENILREQNGNNENAYHEISLSFA